MEGKLSSQKRQRVKPDQTIDPISHIAHMNNLSGSECTAKVSELSSAFQGGNAKNFLRRWQQLTRDIWVTKHIEGVRPNFLIKPRQFNYPRQFNWSTQELQIIDIEIEALMRKKVIQKVSSPSSDQFISNIFLRKKSNGTYRVILNLKSLNEFVVHSHFKMDTLRDAILLITRGCFFSSIDLQDAFYTIPLAEDVYKYFRFLHRDAMYEFTCLVMGYSDSPRIFTKLMKPILAHLREQNVQVMMYIDDALIVHNSFNNCIESTEKFMSLITSLGFHISEEKSQMVPSTQIDYLGFTLNSIDMSVRPSQRRVSSVKNQIDSLLLQVQSHLSLRDLAKIIGTLNALTPGNRYGTVFCKRLEIQKNFYLRHVLGDYDRVVTITTEMRARLSLLDCSKYCGNSSRCRPHFLKFVF